MYKRATFTSALIFVLSLSGCNSKENNHNNIVTQKVDSLIKINEVNDCTILVKFGYDAVTALKTTKGIVLIDAGISTFLAAKYKSIIENKFRQKNFVYIINSHGHHDHVRGNSLFPQAKVIGQVNIQTDVSDTGNNPESLLMRINKIVEDYDFRLQHSIPNTTEWENNFTQKIRYRGSFMDANENIPFRLPDITFSDSLNLECGDTAFELKYFGKFHSNSDILIYVPASRLLFTGDLFSKYGRPNMANSSITDEDRWIQSIKWIRNRINNIETIIDGHGQILTIEDLKSFNDNILKKCSVEEANNANG